MLSCKNKLQRIESCYSQLHHHHHEGFRATHEFIDSLSIDKGSLAARFPPNPSDRMGPQVILSFSSPVASLHSLCVVHAHGEKLAPELPICALKRPLHLRLSNGGVLVEFPDVKGVQNGVGRRRVESREDVGEVIARVCEYNVTSRVLKQVNVKRRFVRAGIAVDVRTGVA